MNWFNLGLEHPKHRIVGKDYIPLTRDEIETIPGHTDSTRIKRPLSAMLRLIYPLFLVFLLCFSVGCLYLTKFGSPYSFAFREDVPIPRIVKVSMYLGSGANVGQLSTALNGSTTYHRALQSHQRHSDLHGHRQVIHSTDTFGGEIEPVFNKLASLQSLIVEELRKPQQDRSEWLFWHDADTIVMNPTVPLDVFLPPADQIEKHFLVAHDARGMNAGVFFLRVSSWSLLFLSSALGMSKSQQQLPEFEQTAMQNLVRDVEYFKKGYQQLPKHWFNSYPTLRVNGEIMGDESSVFKAGYFMVHIVGNLKLDPTLFESHLAIAERHEIQWENNSEVHKLQNEALAFWKDIPISIEV